MKKKTVELSGIGTVSFESSPRAKRISVSIRPYKGVRVAVPYGVSFDKARIFAQSKASWIKKHLVKMELLEYRAKAAAASAPINRPAVRNFLIDRLNYLAQRYGFTYNRVFIRNQKTRWGSCSTKNNINLNVNLVRLPQKLIDYTIVHELVHTRFKNHGPGFWDQMDALLGDAKKIDRELRAYEYLLI